jgi:hypothetical protein
MKLLVRDALWERVVFFLVLPRFDSPSLPAKVNSNRPGETYQFS